MHTTVMLVEDHPLMRDVLAYVVDREPGLQVVATAADGKDAITLGLRIRPEVVVMDVRLPGCDGLQATRELCREMPGVRVVMLSVSCTCELIHTAFDAGACGYLVKNGSPQQLIDAIRSAAEGGRPLGSLARSVLAR